jgi:hypothetical protein
VNDLSRRPDGVVEIMVGEEVAAYLVSPEKLRELQAARESSTSGQRASIAGMIEVLVDDLDAALAQVGQEAEEDLLAKVDAGG